jgi:hypothetical protein
MTIYKLKQRNIADGGHFFDRATMKQFGDTLKGFGVRRDVDPAQVIVTRKRDGKSWRFDVATGRMRAYVSA